MNGLVKLVLAALRFGAITRRPWGVALLCMLLAVSCTVGAVACAIAALWIWLIPHFGPVGAPLIVAAALLILAAILILVAKRLLTPRHAAVAPSAEALAGEIGRLLQEHKGMALLLTAVAGLVLGRKK
jgi:hypothetical protein